MKQILRQNKIFLGLCLIYIIILGVVLLLCPKADLHLWLNAHHTAAADWFFRNYSVIAEWGPYVVVLALLFYKVGWSLFLFVNIVVSGLVGQWLKYRFQAPRPLTYFEENFPDIQLPLVDGVEMHRYLSFPSGHAITFFVLFFTLCLIVTEYLANSKQRYPNGISTICQVVCFLLAVTGCYSRIYLSQHFAADIWSGCIVGMAVSLLFCALLPLISDKKWYKYHFFQKKSQKNLVE